MPSKGIIIAGVSGAAFAFGQRLVPIDNPILRAAAAGAAAALIVNAVEKRV